VRQRAHSPVLQKGGTLMTRFEYKCVWIFGGGETTARVLNDYGKDGWELVATCIFWHYLKRQLA
jgi:hypothetical protein